MDNRLKILSLGQGQGRIAEKLIDQGQRTGDWVCLQNCHLSASWMPELEKIQERQNEAEMHPEYRLWLTSMPSKDFPVPVLQNGIKLTNEPPKGLKANLKRTFNEVTEEDYEGCNKPREYKKLLFALAYFHAVILERRKYGAIGWNIPYEWMNSDFVTSKT
jgi:dynein heavy chain